MNSWKRLVVIGFYIGLVLFLLDGLTPVDIKLAILKKVVYYALPMLAVLTLIFSIKNFYQAVLRITTILLTLVVIGLMVVSGPFSYLNSGGVYHTQTVLYQHQKIPFRYIEFQMQDVGAFGYNRRTVEVQYLAPVFMHVRPVDTSQLDKNKWKLVDEEVDELRLKGG